MAMDKYFKLTISLIEKHLAIAEARERFGQTELALEQIEVARALTALVKCALKD